MPEPPDYRTPPAHIDMQRAERMIRRAGLLSLAALAVAVPVGILLIPALIDLPHELPQRLAFAARASVPVLMCVVVAILMVSTTRRFSPADIGGSAAGPPSAKLAIPAAFLQNTLEQAVIAIGLYAALATLLTGRWLALIPIGVVFFIVGRILFLRGYARGIEGRAVGMALTMTPTILGYLLALVLLVARWLQTPAA